MKTLVIYDSMHGNTEKIAEAIVRGISGAETKIIQVSKAVQADLEVVGILIIGSPTHGGRPTPALQQFLDQIPDGALKNIKVATFDTRILEKDQNIALRILMKTIGYAGPRIMDILIKKGGNMIVPAEGFIVNDKKGPLKDNELERATDWGKKISS